MNPQAALAPLRNGESMAWQDVPRLALEELQETIAASCEMELHVASLFALRDSGGERVLLAVLAEGREGRLHLGRAPLPDDVMPSLTPRCPQVHLFEREIAEQFSVRLAGHPWPGAVRFSLPFDHPGDATPPPVGVTEFYRIEGAEIHEVAVGPVHAGVIEPGHFRFQCHGEHVFHLEISLGYQHRGIEEALLAGPHRASLHQVETLAGDTTTGHALAWCQNMEALADLPVPAHAHVVRALALELERLANHTGDLGALANDVGFLPTAAYCGRIRGDFLNLTGLLCGNRFGRSLVVPGGVRFGLDQGIAAELERRLAEAQADVTSAAELLWVTPSVMARFEGTGAVSAEAAALLGLVGPAARACGGEEDVRADHPTGAYRFLQLPIATAQTGDVQARAVLRWLEIQRSIEYAQLLLGMLPPTSPPPPRAFTLAPDRVAVSLVEGWRGEICHVAVTGPGGRLLRYKVVDPSFHNWAGLAMALRDQEISDFPLCNKSFNLSYCGHDL